MAGFQRREAPSDFKETVFVGRNFVSHPDVKMTYSSTSREFRVQGGIVRSNYEYGGNRQLTIETTDTDRKHHFTITRERGGEYQLHTGGFHVSGPHRKFVR